MDKERGDSSGHGGVGEGAVGEKMQRPEWAGGMCQSNPFLGKVSLRARALFGFSGTRTILYMDTWSPLPPRASEMT